ncbi:PLP-dependent aminotransferase family protein [Kosakonia radicincitans]|uniref:MocR-like pyridoxine biosynthesis transcription factor PdxR n=1 Tax=Kosakonia radicincitans TaxID=283686 RepID=UPI0008BC0FAF|nr:PLP-dependent aminotransferase family protein [Kosakonia radicincitans]SES93200.1 GntR family transcriptional regulator / MocR family aminotransferase [Kosakonia radicincitans]
MKPGYKSIYEQYRHSIVSGLLKPGDKVPSVRVLASELGVARKTVETAWAILVGEGYLISHGARGTRVNPDLILPARKPASKQPVAEEKPTDMMDVLRDQQGFLRLGIPSLDAFPYKKWLLLCGKAVRSMQPLEMTNPPLAGYAPLREAIAHYVNVSRGLSCTADQVFITSGYSNNLRLILNTLATDRDKVLFEDPGYFFGQQALKRAAANLHFVPVDDQGMNVDYLLRYHPDARLLFVTPSHQSPLAVTMSLPRKHQLLKWASQNESWIVEDDYDGEFHYTRKVLPAMKSLDSDDRVIYMGTFSKTVMPALRISYLVLPRAALARFHETAALTESGQPVLTQKILAAFLGEGHFYQHLKKMRTLYSLRRKNVLAALENIYPHLFSVEVSDGGMHIIAFLRTSTQDVALAEIWQRHELQVSALSRWYNQTSKRYGLIIGYTNVRSYAEAEALLQRPVIETRALLGGQ